MSLSDPPPVANGDPAGVQFDLFQSSKSPATRRPPNTQTPSAPALDRLVARQPHCQTTTRTSAGEPITVPTLIEEFWTSSQRAANSLHEVSYRACFKPQLPRFFIERLSGPGDRVYDPFMGRGTTLLEAALLGRIPMGCDINPLSRILIGPRLHPPTLDEIRRRLEKIDFRARAQMPEELLVFYHADTLRQICALRKYLRQRRAEGTGDRVDDWITLVAVNRLTGHSPGFFSVYTMPPNQAVSVKSQRKINKRRKQTPPPRDVPAIILKKSGRLLADCGPTERRTLARVAPRGLLLTRPAAETPEIRDDSVALVVTSPPFLNVVDYALDNWLRCWFVDVDPATVRLTAPRKVEVWEEAMTRVLRELHRLVRRGGHVAFEVGEVGGGTIQLEEKVIPCGHAVGLQPEWVLINTQKFTKTANCWGVDNNVKGTNTNRIVLFRKP